MSTTLMAWKLNKLITKLVCQSNVAINFTFHLESYESILIQVCLSFAITIAFAIAFSHFTFGSD